MHISPIGKQIKKRTQRFAIFISFNSSLVFPILSLSKESTEYIPIATKKIPIIKIMNEKVIFLIATK